MCGFSMWVGDSATDTDESSAAYNPHGIVPWGDVDGATGDDPVLPSKFWPEGYAGFIRDIKPPLLDQFFVQVVDDSAGHCFKGSALRTGLPALLTLLVAVLVSYAVSM